MLCTKQTIEVSDSVLSCFALANANTNETETCILMMEECDLEGCILFEEALRGEFDGLITLRGLLNLFCWSYVISTGGMMDTMVQSGVGAEMLKQLSIS